MAKAASEMTSPWMEAEGLTRDSHASSHLSPQNARASSSLSLHAINGALLAREGLSTEEKDLFADEDETHVTQGRNGPPHQGRRTPTPRLSLLNRTSIEVESGVMLARCFTLLSTLTFILGIFRI